jgi:hypothetical protein
MKKILLLVLEAIAKDVRHKVGEKASCSGLWRSGNEYIALTEGERFPFLGGIEWVLVVSV